MVIAPITVKMFFLTGELAEFEEKFIRQLFYFFGRLIRSIPNY